MKLTFIGADHEVTGSCHFLEVAGKKIIIDYGMEQGVNLYVNQEPPFTPGETDYVFVTHAHIDHTGLLPLLYARGFKGQIFATNATTELCNLMLRDCAHIQAFEAEWKSRKNQRKGLPAVTPIYDLNDVTGVLNLFVPCDYNKEVNVCDGIKIRFLDAGHLLGSASIEMWLTEDGITKKIIFSGDIGNFNQPLIKNPVYPESADYVVMESTYGDRSHGKNPDYYGCLSNIIEDTFARGGNVVIPCFAVGRTQEVLYFLRKIKQENRVPAFTHADVYVDSPLAVSATNVFGKNMEECFDEETLALIHQGINPIAFPGLKLSVTSDESKQINFDTKPKVILSASGMCDAGRIRHHLKHNLWRKDSTIVFAGYQAVGTPGRAILDGAQSIKLFGEEIAVNARIEMIQGISGHADREGLLRWVDEFKEKPSRIFVVHGNDDVCDKFSDLLHHTFGVNAKAPYSGASFDLIKNEWICQGVKEPFKKELSDAATSTYVTTGRHAAAAGKSENQISHGEISKGRIAGNAAFTRLLAAGERLLAVIHRNEGSSNKDLGKFASQINSLCDKWDH